jgi:hypothetical protein
MPVKKVINGFFVLSFIASLFSCATALTQKIPSHDIIQADKLFRYLKEDVKKQIVFKGKQPEKELVQYFRVKFSERFFYDWQTFEDRFTKYNQIYVKESSHIKRANDHRQKYADSTQ